MRDLFSPKNLISLLMYFRLSLILPFVIILQSNAAYGRIISAGIIFLIVFFDIIDGKIAKQYGEDTPQRRLKDNIIDKLTVHSTFLFVLFMDNLPMVWYLPLLIRDMSITILGAVGYRRFNAVIYPNLVHKLAILSMAIAGMFIVLKLQGTIVLLGSTYLLMYVAAFDYLGIFLNNFGKTHLVKSSKLIGYHPAMFEGMSHINKKFLILFTAKEIKIQMKRSI